LDTDTLFNGEENDDDCMIQVYLYRSSGTHKKVSQGQFNMAGITGNLNYSVPMSKGELFVKDFKMQPKASFLDYVFGGT
jgi:hypothetical protein